MLTGDSRRTDVGRFPADTWVDVEGADNHEVVAQSIRLYGDVALTTVWWEDEDQIIAALDDE